jgi:1-acyl-sn-glycerol-3-phosphate acyltransferase
MSKQYGKPDAGYRIFKWYVRFFHNAFYYKKVYWINTENIPKNDPLMIVSNHQNGLSDVLGVLMSIRTRQHRKIKVVARADVFRFFNKGLRWLGLLPAYRLSYEGAASLKNNEDSFKEMENELMNDGTIIIYPEAGHQDKRWLGTFSLAYLHVLFKSAEKTNFEKEFFVLPSCNHYSNYFEVREEMLIQYGTPVSIAPYYELYKTKPRTAQRKVNEIVRKQVSDMMLNISDLENYEAIDYLRETYGVRYAQDKGYNPKDLSEKLISDKRFFAELEEKKNENEEKIEEIYEKTLELKSKTEKLGINDSCFDARKGNWYYGYKTLITILLFPLYLLSCIPNVLLLYAPKYLTAKVEDPLLHSGITFGVLVLLAPVLYAATFVLLMFLVTNSFWIIFASFQTAFLYLLSFPLLGFFFFNYRKSWKSLKTSLRFERLLKKGKLNDIIDLRIRIFDSLNELLN